MATQGELLTRDGWQRAPGLYASPSPGPGLSVFYVVSNYWGAAEERRENRAEVELWFGGVAGQKDSSLRFSPSKVRDSDHAVEVDRLALVPSHLLMYGPDGNTVIEDKLGPVEWRIQGPPGRP
jgi:hypothetical protein